MAEYKSLIPEPGFPDPTSKLRAYVRETDKVCRANAALLHKD